MNGGKDCEGGEREGLPPFAQVPIGWQRRVDCSGVVYISPSGSVLSCLDQVKSYLLTDGTCKCGLECPLILPKVFNFDPEAAVKQRTAEDVQADDDVTKLCMHKRKIIAVATLNRSMESPHPSLVLTSPGGGTSVTPLVPPHSGAPRAIRNKLHEGPPGSLGPDCRNPFRMIMAGQRHYQPEQEMFAGHPRARLASAEPGQRSPYRQASMMSPASYRDGSLSPRTDPLGSPDVFSRSFSGSFHGAGSPSPLNGNGRPALSSPPGLSHQGSPASQSCVLAGRTNVPLSPTVSAKSPIMKKPACSGFPPSMEPPRGVYHHQPPPPSCALQKQQVTSEKDPLGILDPIPSKPVCQSPAVALNPNFQPGVHSQVPAMNVNMPPTIVPLRSNLPLPTVKPGHANPAGHAQRVQHMASVSPSPVTSPIHAMGPALGRMEASPQRSRSSSSSSDHGSFAMLPGPQASCGGAKVPPRSPRPSVAPSPSAKPDALHQYKDVSGQLLSGMNSTLSGQSGAVFPASKNHAGLLGMPLNHILNQHNSSSFPASSLLSAAAKAQLANQSKTLGSSNGGGGPGACGNSANPSSVGGNPEGHAVSNSMPLGVSEGQSGRAALRDKLMAHQRDPLRKRKLPNSVARDDGGFAALKSHMGGARPQGAAEQLRKARAGGLLPNTSMAQLLQSMSYQSSQLAGNGAPVCQSGQPGGTSTQLHFRDGVAPAAPPHHALQPGRGDGLHCQSVDGGLMHAGSREQFGGLMDQGHPSSLGPCGALGQGGQAPRRNCSLGHRDPHLQQVAHRHHQPLQGQPHSLGQVTVATMAPNANGGSCNQAMSETGDSLNSSLRDHQFGNLQAHVANNGPFPQQPPRAVQAHQGVPGFRAPHPLPNNSSSNPMACLFQNFQVGLSKNVSVSSTQTCATRCAQSGMMSLPEISGEKIRNISHELRPQSMGPGGPGGMEGLPGGGGESVDTIYRAVVEAASQGVPVVITTSVSSTAHARPIPTPTATSAFTGSLEGPENLPHPCQEPLLPEAEPRPQLRPGRPRAEQRKSTPDGGEDYFRSPGAQRRQWEREAACHALSWQGEEFLECSAQVRGSPCTEGYGGLTPGPPRLSEHQHARLPPGDKAFLEDRFRFDACQRAVVGGGPKEQAADRCAHMNGGPLLPGNCYGDVLGPSRHEPVSEDQSPSSSTSLEGSLHKDYAHYNGHYNGCAASPSDREEDLRHPDSPLSGDLLHFRPRAFHMGQLVWSQIKGFPPWQGKLLGEEQMRHSGLQNSEQGKVDPGKLKTLTQDLEAFNRAAKRNRRGGKLNNHLEAAIHVTMSELDRMSGSVHQMPPRDRQLKPPKRRKISR
ncbi:methyl-CpG-binding domain protein 5-like isoform X2 [Conger conger]|uniref:methyl-CpG-binding domain protein 5-like isoform X2 n=1 Tax=Conger conger TaxID=82655 RepID=UPI002A59C31D|nr:methyl-CpG-binding domain protein 5-like isoform X2 [Conger conger]